MTKMPSSSKLFPSFVKLVEVSPRDGLQNEAIFIPTAVKIDFINQLSETGLSVIEATSFVSPKWVPQLADGEAVFSGINKKEQVQYPVLVPNMTGLSRALRSGASAIAVFSTASEIFSQKNTHCSVEESRLRLEGVILAAKKENCVVRGYLSCVLGSPFHDPVPFEQTALLAKHLYQLGCDEISLGDTIGVGTPGGVLALLAHVAKYVPIDKIAVHFHDTYGQALANIYAALSAGVAIVDASVSGIGGCPYAKGATGNVATEDVLYLLMGLGIKTGVDLKRLMQAGKFISNYLKRPSQSKVNIAYEKNQNIVPE